MPLCVKCKMNGSHSSEPNASHKIIEIKQIYEDAKKEAEMDDPSIKKRKVQIMNELKKIEAKRTDVVNKFKSIEERIFAKMKELLAALDMEVGKKLNVLRSDECELFRRKEELEYCEAFLKDCKDNNSLNPLPFIHFWLSHKKSKEDLLKKPLILGEIQQDIKLERSMHIVSDTHIKNTNVEAFSADKNPNA